MIQLSELINLLGDDLGDPMLTIMPGPDDPDTPTRFVKITPGTGLGLNTESLYDQREFAVESVGDQESYVSAEGLAFDVDRFFLRFIRQKVGGVMVQGFTRGGGPSVLLIDDSRRWHFVCNYTADVQSALTA